MVRHTTYSKSDGIIYAVTHGFTLSSAVFSLFLLWGLILNVSEGVPLLSMVHIILLLLFTLCGATYRDSWYFNVKEQTIQSVFGFAWFVKRETFSFAEVKQLQLTHFVKGSSNKETKPNKRRYRAMIVFSLQLTDERVKDIEIIAEKTSGGRTESAMQAIALATSLPLFVDRPRDLDLDVSYRDF